MSEYRLTVNGKDRVINENGTKLLADVIREDLELTGTKVGCRTGECGACTVLIDGEPNLSCLLPTSLVRETEITTIEHLSVDPGFQRLMQEMDQQGGTQCGFCTPGMMVTLYAWMNTKHQQFRVEDALKNNICRCTGYVGIHEAALRAKQG